MGRTMRRARAAGAARRRMRRNSAPPAARAFSGSRAASGAEELRDSERSRGCRRDAVAVRFRYPAPQVTVGDDALERSVLNRLCSVQNQTLRFGSCRLNRARVGALKTDGEETRQSSYKPNRVCVSLTQSLQETVHAAAGTACRLSSSRDAASQAHGSTLRARAGRYPSRADHRGAGRARGGGERERERPGADCIGRP
jgi:hypothetical protein